MRSLSTLAFFFVITLINISADAWALVELDVAVNNKVTITATRESALVSKAGNTGVGFILESPVGSSGGAGSDTDPASTFGFKSAVAELVGPRLLSVMSGIHMLDPSNGSSTSVTAGEQAFVGTTHCSLNNPIHSALRLYASNA